MNYFILSFISILSVLPVQAQKSLLDIGCSQAFLRKGFHLGGHIAPGVGRINQESLIGEDDDSEIAFAMNAGLDVVYYFNDIFAIKSGFKYTMLQATYTFNYSSIDLSGYPILPIHNDGTEVQKLHSFGIPLKVVLTSQGKVGFYLDAGVLFLFPMDSHATLKQPYFNVDEELFYELNTVVLNVESTIGVNFQLSDYTSLNLGLLGQVPLTDYYDSDRHKDGGFLVAVQLGIMWKIKRSDS